MGGEGVRGSALLVALLLCAPAAFAAEEAKPEPPERLAPLVSQLRQQKAAQDRRARELDDRERHLEELEKAVADRIGELEKITDTVEQRIASWEAANGDSLRKLAKIYAAMPAERAARLVEAMDVDLATQIVAKMKDKQSAALLARLSRKRALAMSRKVAHPLAMEPAVPAHPGDR